MSAGHFVAAGSGEAVPLGVITMRVLVDGATTDGHFSVLEFAGGPGAWTVPHRHLATEESFYVASGDFTFRCGEDDVSAGPGDYLLVPRGTTHMITAGESGGSLVAFTSPAGLEDMFRELGRLDPDAIRDPETRRSLAARFDSVPV